MEIEIYRYQKLVVLPLALVKNFFLSFDILLGINLFII